MSPRYVDKEEKKTEILKAAMGVFAVSGEKLGYRLVAIGPVRLHRYDVELLEDSGNNVLDGYSNTRILFYIDHTRADLADAMQEAFIRAYDALQTCRNPDRFGAWFFRILTNQCHDVIARRRETTDLAAVDPPARDRTDRPLELAELNASIAAALEELTPEQREAFVMKHLDGRTYEEMAELLGVGVDALKMRVHRARDTLQALLEGLA